MTEETLTTLKTIESTVSRLCKDMGFTFRRFDGPPRYWTVIDNEGFRYLYNIEELADYAAKLLKSIKDVIK